jgi:hypothetical protein
MEFRTGKLCVRQRRKREDACGDEQTLKAGDEGLPSSATGLKLKRTHYRKLIRDQ